MPASLDGTNWRHPQRENFITHQMRTIKLKQYVIFLSAAFGPNFCCNLPGSRECSFLPSLTASCRDSEVSDEQQWPGPDLDHALFPAQAANCHLTSTSPLVQVSDREQKKLNDKQRRLQETAARNKADALRDDDNVFDVSYENQGGAGDLGDTVSATDIKVKLWSLLDPAPVSPAH